MKIFVVFDSVFIYLFVIKENHNSLIILTLDYSLEDLDIFRVELIPI